jgi:hypothetical protein
MSTDCSFFGGSSGNPACANWWITLVHASQNKHNTPKHRLLLNMNRSKKLNYAFVDTGIFGQHDPG